MYADAASYRSDALNERSPVMAPEYPLAHVADEGSVLIVTPFWVYVGPNAEAEPTPLTLAILRVIHRVMQKVRNFRWTA